MGKTTFLHMWEPMLKEHGFHIVTFNAWKTDFADEPFLALWEELRERLEQLLVDDQAAVSKLKKAAAKVLKFAGQAVVRNLAAHVLGATGDQIAKSALAALADERLTQYGEAKKAFEEFREALQAAACTLKEESDSGSPLAIVIDELDRCRPSYAVELLELLKHLYSVDGVVFVLAVNRRELVHSVRALYGAKFGAEVYLRRFIDIDVHLPDSSREDLIDSHLDSLQSEIQSINPGSAAAQQHRDLDKDWLVRFFGTQAVDLRTLEQALRRFGLMLAMRGGGTKTAVFALVLRTLEPDLYYRFLQGTATDADVADALFQRVDEKYRSSYEGQNLETEIILAAVEDDPPLAIEGGSTSSQLLKHYQTLVDSEAHEATTSPELQHAHTIVSFVTSAHRGRLLRKELEGFRITVAQLEMLSPNLLAI